MARCCDGSYEMNRREMLRQCGTALSFGVFGFSFLDRLFLQDALGVTPVSPLYDSIIQIFHSGGPSQTDTWDPKPGSTSNIYGTIPIGANDIYGKPISISDRLPNIASLVKNDPTIKLGLVRSITHRNGDHYLA